MKPVASKEPTKGKYRLQKHFVPDSFFTSARAGHLAKPQPKPSSRVRIGLGRKTKPLLPWQQSCKAAAAGRHRLQKYFSPNFLTLTVTVDFSLGLSQGHV